MASTQSTTLPRGSIIRIQLSNFLTFDDVELRPGPNLNLLLGPNGAGKSTIVCALCLGLAGTPQNLGRSAKLDDYVKYGRDRATIEIELSDPQLQKQPVIKSVIRRGGANEFFLNEKKVTKAELRKIVESYHIQVDNPCQFLAQDKVVEFARQSKQDLLINTEKAAGSVDLYEQHVSLKNRAADVHTLRTELINASHNQSTLEQQVKTLEEPYRQFEAYERAKEELELMKKKRPWLEYMAGYEEFQQLAEKRNTIRADFQKRERELAPLKQQLDTKAEENCRNETRFRGQKKRIDDAKHEFTQRIEGFRSLSKQMKDIKSQLQSQREDVQKKRDTCNMLRKQAEKFQAQLEALDDADVEPSLETNRKQLEGANRQLDRQEADKTDVEEKLHSAQAQLRRVVNELNVFENRQKQQIENLRRTNESVYQAYVLVKENEQQFRGNVWLPVIDVTIPDIRNAKFLEAAMSNRDFYCFIFEYHEDVQKFHAMADRRNIKVGSGLISDDSTNFSPIVDSELKKLGFRDFICNMFEAPPGLKRYLTKLGGLHLKPVGTTATEQNIERVMQVIRDRYGVFFTDNKRYAIRKSRYSGECAVTSSHIGNANIFPAMANPTNDNESDSLRNSHKQLTSEIEQMNAQMQMKNHEIGDLRRQIEKLREERESLNQKKMQRPQLQMQLDVKMKHIAQNERSMVDIEKEEQSATERLNKKIEEKMAFIKRILESMKNIEELSMELGERSLARPAIIMTQTALQREYNTRVAEMENDRRKVSQVDQEYTEKKSEVKALRKQAQKALDMDPSGGDEIPEQYAEVFAKLPDDVEELDCCISERTQLMQTNGFDENIAHEYLQKKAAWERAQAEAENLKNRISIWEEDVTDQRNAWLEQVRKLISSVSADFSNFMALLDCNGDVTLDEPENVNDFDKYGVSIKVRFRPDQPLRDLSPECQSGGERAVCTMLYMLALQKLSHVPFRCVDEINQGMDPTNERRVFDIMTKLIGSGTGVLNTTQYFILTPKLLRDLVLGDLTTVCMVYNGSCNVDWNIKKFLKRRAVLNSQ